MRDEGGNRLVRARDDPPRVHPRYGYLVRDPRPIRKQPRKRKRVCLLATNSQVKGIGLLACAERETMAEILRKIAAGPDRNRAHRRAKFWTRRKHG